MGALNRLEDLLERLVETSFARVARARLQPVEIAKRAAREMERRQIVGVNRVLVPNFYEIWLNPSDYAFYAAMTGTLQAEIASYLHEYAAQRSFALPGPASVTLGEDSRVRPHQIYVEAHLEDPLLAQASEREQGVGATSVMPAMPPPPPAPPAVPTVAAYLIATDGQRHDLEPGVVTLGRSPDNIIALDDKRVSRYHARLRLSGGHWTLTDVGSTNGTFVNGKQIRQHTVLEGDVISLGGVDLVFHQTWVP